jgi:hypothetical protein
VGEGSFTVDATTHPPRFHFWADTANHRPPIRTSVQTAVGKVPLSRSITL